MTDLCVRLAPSFCFSFSLSFICVFFTFALVIRCVRCIFFTFIVTTRLIRGFLVLRFPRGFLCRCGLWLLFLFAFATGLFTIVPTFLRFLLYLLLSPLLRRLLLSLAFTIRMLFMLSMFSMFSVSVTFVPCDTVRPQIVSSGCGECYSSKCPGRSTVSLSVRKKRRDGFGKSNELSSDDLRNVARSREMNQGN